MPDDFSNEIAPPTKPNWLLIVVLIAVAGSLFAWLLKNLQPPQPQGARAHPSVGKPMPRIEAQGWLNGPAPTAEELEGKVRVLEAWAHWCGPCLRAAPHTVELYEQFKDKDVVFIGLTSETAQTLEQSKKFLRKAKFTWPSAYGVTNTLVNLYEIDYTPVPMMWVVNKQGIIAWAGHPGQLSEEMLDELVAEPFDSPEKLTPSDKPADGEQPVDLPEPAAPVEAETKAE